MNEEKEDTSIEVRDSIPDHQVMELPVSKTVSDNKTASKEKTWEVKKAPIWPFMPLLITVVGFFVAQLGSRMLCAGDGECEAGWLWLLLWPLFFIMFIGSILFALIATVIINRKS